MKSITHDGEEYVLKTDIEAAFKDRISKLSARALQAEETSAQLQEKLDTQSGELTKISTLQEKITTLEASLKDAEGKFTRVSMLSEHGFIDPDLRDAVEWAYQRANTETPLEEWIKGIKANPETAPSILRPHLQSKEAAIPSSEPSQVSAPEASPAMQMEDQVLIPPKTNTGAKPAPVQSGDIIKRAVQDPEFYAANRDAIKKAWANRKF